MTEEEARKLGFTEEVQDDAQPMTEEEARAKGFTEDVSEPEKPGHGLATFGVNALDALSIVGVPRVLAAKDTLTSGDPSLDRYAELLKKYQAAKRASDAEEPVAAIAGQFAPAFIPGPKGTSIGRGAALGGLHGLLGGDASLAEGDVEGTVLETALGAAGGAGGELLGSLLGRAMKSVGESSKKQLEAGISRRVRSLIGKYGQKKKDAVGADRNLALQDALEALPGMKGNTPAGQLLRRLRSRFPGIEQDLQAGTRGNAAKEFRRFEGSRKRFGPSGIPSVGYATDVANRQINSTANRAIKELASTGARIGVGGLIGEAVLPQFGFSDRESAGIGGALAGGSKLWAIRRLATAIAKHPTSLAAIGAKFPALGQKLATIGGSGGAVVGYLTALLATRQGQDAVSELVQEGQIDPIAFEDGGAEDAGVDAGVDGGSDFLWQQDAEEENPDERKLKKGFRLLPSRNVPSLTRQPPTSGDL